MFSVTADIDPAKKLLANSAKQARFALSVALTRTASLIRIAEYDKMREVFDRPTPYTLRSLFSTRATPANLEAKVLWRSFGGGTLPENYLHPHVYGGGRETTRWERAVSHSWQYGVSNAGRFGAFIIPGQYAPLDQYGNLARPFIMKILSALKTGGVSDATQHASKSRRSRKKRALQSFFIGRDTGERYTAIWERRGFAFGSSVRPIAFFTKNPQYTKRFPLYEVANSTMDTEFRSQFKRALDEALATAR